MKEFATVNDILDFAIKAEQAAVDFYSHLASQSRNDDMKQVFEEFSQEEMGHKARLTTIKESGIPGLSGEKIADLRIADYIVDVKAEPEMSYADALVLAMKREKSAFRLYMDLSRRVADTDLKQTFLALAMEESKHKLRFELEYDEFVLREN